MKCRVIHSYKFHLQIERWPVHRLITRVFNLSPLRQKHITFLR